jgi:hypothetical protein
MKGHSRVTLVPETASTRDLAVALNGFHNNYQDKCLKDEMVLANQLDVNDGEINAKNVSRVI